MSRFGCDYFNGFALASLERFCEKEGSRNEAINEKLAASEINYIGQKENLVWKQERGDGQRRFVGAVELDFLQINGRRKGKLR